jgi:hypothetical protein
MVPARSMFADTSELAGMAATPDYDQTVPVLHRPLKIGIVALALTGVALAATGAIAAFSHHQTGHAGAFVVVAVVLATAALLFVRGLRWAVAVWLVALAGQLAAIVGTIWELTHGIATAKAQQLRSLGFDPTTAVIINLMYSTVGFALFCWFAWRWWSQRRRSQSVNNR